jgi:hypothetical protein
MKTVRVEIRGIQPLLMKSGRGVDPTDPLVKRIKAITSKRKKTDSDILQLDRLEFECGLYWDESQERVYVPDFNIVGLIRDGAKANRRGKEMSAGVEPAEERVPLVYDGPKDIDGLYEAGFVDRRMVKNKGSGGSVMRVRPRFKAWGLSFSLLVDDQVATLSDVRSALENAGLRVGLGDFRPRFGRFEVVGWKEAA